MGLLETLILYSAVGLAVSVAVFVSQGDSSGWQRVFQPTTAIFFWPLYIPLLLTRRDAQQTEDTVPTAAEPEDSMAAAVRQVESELASALTSRDGWAEDVLAREEGRIEELVRAWKTHATRIREMDKALAAEDAQQRSPALKLHEANERLRKSAESRQRNLEKLKEVRCRAYEDFMGTLAWVRELVSMIQLAKFTGAPASRAGELVAQIAASVEGLSKVTEWTESAGGKAAARQ